MNPEFLDSMSWEMAEVYGSITDQILINLARHFPYYNAGDPLPKSAFEYQAVMLAQMGQVNRETIRIIRNNLEDADEALQSVLEQAVIDSVRKAEPDLLEAVKKGILQPAGVPIVAPNQMKAFKTYYAQAADKLNLVNTVMLESTKSAYQQAITDVVSEIGLADSMNRLQIALDTAAGETITGVSSWNAALKHATDRMKETGITGFVDHGGHHWSAEAYVAMDVRTTTFNTARAAVWEENQNFGNDLYMVSYHNGARPKCYPWQNKVISSLNAARDVQDLDGNTIHVFAQSETSYGEAAGLFGINCKHYPTPFIPGVSEIDGTPQNEEENAKSYAESQQQRRMERKLREEKRDIMMAKAQGASQEEIDRLTEKARQSSADIDEFCKQTGRARHRDREAVYTKREFPDKEKYDVAAFENKQKEAINQYFSGGGSQSGYTFGQMTPNEPITPPTPPVANVASQATQTTQNVVQSQTGTPVMGTKDFSELKTHMMNSYGISVDTSVESLNFETVREALSGFERVAQDFPEVTGRLKTITTGSSGVMSCNGSQITFNPRYYMDAAKLQETAERQVNSGFWVKNASAMSVGAHETGHAVEGLLIDISGKYPYRFEQVEAWNKGLEAKAIRSEAAKAIKKTPYGKGKLNTELFEAISGYAKTDASETLAEAFADVYANGQNANPLSLKIYELTVETYRKYKTRGIP